MCGIIAYKAEKINQYSLSGEFIKTWDSISQALKTLNINKH